MDFWLISLLLEHGHSLSFYPKNIGHSIEKKEKGRIEMESERHEEQVEYRVKWQLTERNVVHFRYIANSYTQRERTAIVNLFPINISVHMRERERERESIAIHDLILNVRLWILSSMDSASDFTDFPTFIDILSEVHLCKSSMTAFLFLLLPHFFAQFAAKWDYGLDGNHAQHGRLHHEMMCVLRIKWFLITKSF